MSDLLMFLRAVLGHWVALMSGGIITVTLAVWERYKGYDVPGKLYAAIILFFVFLAGFLAWRDQYKRGEKLEERLSSARPYFSLQKSEVVQVKNEKTGQNAADVVSLGLTNIHEHPATRITGHLILIDNKLNQDPFELTVIRRANDLAQNAPFFINSKPLKIPDESEPWLAFCELTYRDAFAPEGADIRQAWYLKFSGSHQGLFLNGLFDAEPDDKERINVYMSKRGIPIP